MEIDTNMFWRARKLIEALEQSKNLTLPEHVNLTKLHKIFTDAEHAFEGMINDMAHIYDGRQYDDSTEGAEF